MSESDKSISTNSRSVLVGLLFLVGLVLLVYTISVSVYSADEVGRLSSVFIASISGTLALGGTLITQLWGGGNSSSNLDRPVFYLTIPQDSAVKVPLNTSIIASSNTQLDPTTINSKTFTLKDGSNALVEGTITLEGGNALFKPKESLKPSTKYTATLSKDIRDISGRLLTIEKIWSFSTIDH